MRSEAYLTRVPSSSRLLENQHIEWRHTPCFNGTRKGGTSPTGQYFICMTARRPMNRLQTARSIASAERGAALVMALVVLVALTAFGLTLVGLGMTEVAISSNWQIGRAHV